MKGIPPLLFIGPDEDMNPRIPPSLDLKELDLLIEREGETIVDELHQLLHQHKKTKKTQKTYFTDSDFRSTLNPSGLFQIEDETDGPE